jgi:membrane associated rhomboid family serine protease
MGLLSLIFTVAAIGFTMQNGSADLLMLSLAFCFIIAWAISRAFDRELILERGTQRFLLQTRWTHKILRQAGWDDRIVVERYPRSDTVRLYSNSPADKERLLAEIPSRSAARARAVTTRINTFLGRETEFVPHPIFTTNRGDWRTFSCIMTVINSIVFLATLNQAETAFDLNRADFFSGQYWRLFTYMFMHAGILHLTFNSVALVNLGIYLERLLGWRRVALVYFISGLGAGIWALMWVGDHRLVGASGSIFGLLGAICYIVFNAKRLGLPPEIVPDRRGVFQTLLINGAISLLPFVSMAGHVGGLVTGYICAYFVLRRASFKRSQIAP